MNVLEEGLSGLISLTKSESVQIVMFAINRQDIVANVVQIVFVWWRQTERANGANKIERRTVLDADDGNKNTNARKLNKSLHPIENVHGRLKLN